MTTTEIGRMSSLENILSRHGKFEAEEFSANFETIKTSLKKTKILVIGAGGLGCELLKNLALMGFVNIDVIDMDTVDYTNLNRQFLFRKDDVGQPKAVVAAAFINKRITGCNVVPHFCKIQDKKDEFYFGFDIIIAGLDSIDARRWINCTLVRRLEFDAEGLPKDPSKIIPFIDGGTEGFKGQVNIILPGLTNCFECIINLFPPQTSYPVCTIATKPRLPEHCIEWANIVQWPKTFPNEKFNADIPEHVKWMYETAVSRAKEFQIEGVTMRLTLGVVKNIIPAIASTNAIIAAAEANEAFKIATKCALSIDNWMMYMGNFGLYTHTYAQFRKDDCLVCGKVLEVTVDPEWTLEEWLQKLSENPNVQFKKPSLRAGGFSLFIQSPESLRAQTEKHLPMKLKDLLDDGDQLDITDPVLGRPVFVKVIFKS